MEHKIILSDLEKLLFPEYYPYFKNRFEGELNYLRSGKWDDSSIANISFKVKLARYCFNATDPKIRFFLNGLFNQQVDHFYDWQNEYDWHELKPLLLLFSTFNDVKSISDLEKRAKKPQLKRLFQKYLPNQIK